MKLCSFIGNNHETESQFAPEIPGAFPNYSDFFIWHNILQNR